MDLPGFKGFVRELTQSAEDRAIARALKQFSRGQMDRAIETLKEAHTRSPEHSGVLFEMARLLTFAGRAADGADALRSILRRDPKALRQVTETIEEIRVRHRQVGLLLDAVVEHFIRHNDLNAAFKAMEGMSTEDVRAAMSRHRGRRSQPRKGASDTRQSRSAIASAYHLALSHEALRDYAAAAAIYRELAATRGEEVDRLLPRLQALVAKDYQNSTLRLEVAALLLDAGRIEQAAAQFALAIETDAKAAGPVGERVAAHLRDHGEQPDLRWILVSALRAAGDEQRALEETRPLVAAGVRIDDVIRSLTPLAAREKSGAARRLLAEAHMRRGRPQAALEVLLQIAGEEGLPAISEPLQALAKAQPDMMRVHHMLADLHLSGGRGAAAIESLRRVRELAPGEAPVLVRKVTRALESDPASSAAHLLLADLLIETGDRKQAVILLRHLVHQDPDSAGPALERLTRCVSDAGVPRARIGAAEACFALERHGEALEHLEAVISSHPGLEAEFLHLVGLLAEKGPATCGRLVALLDVLRPRSGLPAAVAFVRAEALFYGGERAAAAGAFGEILKSSPEHAGELRQALERFGRDDPDSVEARHLLAGLHLDRRDYAAAVAELTRGEATNPALLGSVLRKFEAILTDSPEDVAARLGLLQVLLRGGYHDRVLKLGEETLPKGDAAQTARVSLIMARALAEKGDGDAAARSYFTAYHRDHGLVTEVVSGLRALDGVEGTHPLASLVLGRVLAAERRAVEAIAALRAAAGADPALRASVLRDLQGLQESCPGDPRAGQVIITLLHEANDTIQALTAIASHLDAHPQDAAMLAAHLDDILKRAPDHPLAHYELGRATQRLGARARAARCYLAAVRLDDALAPLALRRLREILTADPGCIEACRASASILATRGKTMAAAELLGEALGRDTPEAAVLFPDLEEIWKQNREVGRIALLFARVAARAGQHRKALAAYSEAAERDLSLVEEAFEGLDAIIKACPKMPDAHLARGRLHMRRMSFDAALADLIKVSRLAPRLAAVVAIEVEDLRRCCPEARGTALFLADLYAGDGRTAEAMALLRQERDRTTNGGERLSILLRLARLAAAGGDEAEARACLEEAAQLEPKRDRFLSEAHQVLLTMLRGEAARLGENGDQGLIDPGRVESAVRALVDLGEVEQAQAAIRSRADALPEAQTTRLHAWIALRHGDYPRAYDLLKSLGPSRLLAYGAARAGDYVLASQTLECLARTDTDPALQVALKRLYRDMVAAEMLGGSRRLQAETILTFNQREAA